MPERTEDAQTEALRAFLLLCALSSEWQGRLVLVRGLDAEGKAISIAATIAGAACLAVDARAEVCRAALRNGACDFMVNSVDEALRILKNEIRKRKPVSVALTSEENSALEELAVRGVAPEVFIAGTRKDTGKLDGRFSAPATLELPSEKAELLLRDYMQTCGLRVQEHGFSSAQELSLFDRDLATTMPEGDLRKLWARAAPGFFYRDRPFRRVAALRAGEMVAG